MGTTTLAAKDARGTCPYKSIAPRLGPSSVRNLFVASFILQPARNKIMVPYSLIPSLTTTAPYKPGSHPNAVVAPRPHTTFIRPTAPITATVYPQPQSLPTSPSTLGVHRSSPPTQSSPNRFPYNPQAPNGVMIRTPAQPTVQYVVNPERMDISAGQPLVPRQRSPQGPPPRYSVATARPQQQASFDFLKKY